MKGNSKMKQEVLLRRQQREAADRGRYAIGKFTVDVSENLRENFPEMHESCLGWHAYVFQTGFGNELPGRRFHGETREEVEAKAADYVAKAKVWVTR